MKNLLLVFLALGLCSCGTSSSSTAPVPSPAVAPISCNVFQSQTISKTGVITINPLNAMPNFKAKDMVVIGTEALSNFDYPANGSSNEVPGSELTSNNSDFALQCTSNLVVAVSGIYELQLGSDDGSQLLLDRNDGKGLRGVGVNESKPQSFATKTSEKLTLSAGSYPIELEYFQQSGDEGLVLSWSIETSTKPVVMSSPVVIDSSNFSN